MICIHKDDVYDLLEQVVKPTVEASSVHLHDGSVGWYRLLNRNDTIGVVATAQMLSISKLFCSFDKAILESALKTLLKKQNNDGSWPFISTISDTGVIDSTAIVLLALIDFHDRPNVQKAINDGLAWLESSSLSAGGWGIVEKSDFRVYSTCLALRALDTHGRNQSVKYRQAIGELVAARDEKTLLWCGSDRVTSNSISAFVIYTLSSVSQSAGYTAKINSSAKALYNVLKDKKDMYKQWDVEEVELFTTSGRRRIEYKYYTLPLTVLAFLSQDDKTYDRFVFKYAGLFFRKYQFDEFRTSWELHDVALFLSKSVTRLESDNAVGFVLNIKGETYIRETDSSYLVFLKKYKDVFLISFLCFFLGIVSLTLVDFMKLISVAANFLISIIAGLMANKLSK